MQSKKREYRVGKRNLGGFQRMVKRYASCKRSWYNYSARRRKFCNTVHFVNKTESPCRALSDRHCWSPQNWAVAIQWWHVFDGKHGQPHQPTRSWASCLYLHCMRSRYSVVQALWTQRRPVWNCCIRARNFAVVITSPNQCTYTSESWIAEKGDMIWWFEKNRSNCSFVKLMTWMQPLGFPNKRIIKVIREGIVLQDNISTPYSKQSRIKKQWEL